MLAHSLRRTPEELSEAQRVLNETVPDPTGKEPICTAEAFADFVDSWVADLAPRLFAVVQEYGERVDMRIAGWGIAHEDRADVFGVDGTIHKGVSRVEDVLRFFCIGSRVAAHLVWFDPERATDYLDDRRNGIAPEDDRSGHLDDE